MNTTEDKERKPIADYEAEFTFDDLRELEKVDEAIQNEGVEYLRQAEEFEINPDPIPHVYKPHEELAHLCKVSISLFTPGGVLLTILLTSGAVEWPWAGTVGATAVFLILQYATEIGIAAAFRPRRFVDYFHVLFWPWLGLLLGSVSILWLSRNAGPELAAELAKYSTFGWCGGEVSLLFLGACAITGWRRFGWSGAAVRRVSALEARRNQLIKRIDRRRGKLIAGVAVALLFCLQARAACPLNMIDRTGSIADPERMEERWVEAVTAVSGTVPCVRVEIFSGNALSTEATAVDFAGEAASGPVIFRRDIQAGIERQQNNARTKLRDVLHAAGRKPAPCTSMVDVAARALLDPGPVLIITDGVHDCPVSHVELPAQLSPAIFVVLVRSNGDRANEYERISKRAAELSRLLPRARIFVEPQLELAVKEWAAAQAGPGVVAVKTLSPIPRSKFF